MTIKNTYKVNDRIIHHGYGTGSVTYIGTTHIGLRFEKQGDMLLRFDAADISPWSLRAETVWLESLAKAETEKILAKAVPWPKSTFYFEGTDTTHYPASHWEPFVNEPMEIFQNLPEMLQKAQIMESLGNHKTPPRELPPGWQQGFHLVWPMQRQGIILTGLIDPLEQNTGVASLYPFWSEGTQHTIILNQVNVWESGVEAQITASLGEAEITFFDAHFLINRLWYEQGGRYDFILTGFAYTARPAQVMEFPYSPNPDQLAWQALLSDNPDEESIKEPPTVLSLSGMASLLPIADWDNDEYSFRGPVKRIKPFTDYLGQDGWLVRVTVMRLSDYETEDVNLDIVLTGRAWQEDNAPIVDMEIEGTLWLQGYLWMVPN